MSEAPSTVELLIFVIGDALLGVEAAQVLRIDRLAPGPKVGARLGKLVRGGRALVFGGPVGEAQLEIDSVRGLRTVAVESLRRMPALAKGDAIGVWLDEGRPVPLLDLVELSKNPGGSEAHGN